MHAAMNAPVQKQDIWADADLINYVNFWADQNEDKAQFRSQWSKPDIVIRGKAYQNTDWERSGILGDMLGTIAHEWDRLHPSNAWSDVPSVVSEKEQFWRTALQALNPSEQAYSKEALHNLTKAWQEVQDEYTSRPSTPTKRARSGSQTRAPPSGKRSRAGGSRVEDAIMKNGVDSIALHTTLGGTKPNELTDRVMSHIKSAWKAEKVEKKAVEILQIAQRSGVTCEKLQGMIDESRAARVAVRKAAFESAQKKSDVSMVLEPVMLEMGNKVEQERSEMKASTGNMLVVYQQQIEEVDSQMTSIVQELPNRLQAIVSEESPVDPQMLTVTVPNRLPESTQKLLQETAEVKQLAIEYHQVEQDLAIVQNEMLQLTAPPIPSLPPGPITPDQVQADDMVRDRKFNQIQEQRAIKAAQKKQLEEKKVITKTRMGKIAKKETPRKAIQDIKETVAEEVASVEKAAQKLETIANEFKTHKQEEVRVECDRIDDLVQTLHVEKKQIYTLAAKEIDAIRREQREFELFQQNVNIGLVNELLTNQKKNELEDDDIALDGAIHEMKTVTKQLQENTAVELQKVIEIVEQKKEIDEKKLSELEKAMDQTIKLANYDRENTIAMFQANQEEVRNTLLQKDQIVQLIQQRDQQKQMIEVLKAQMAEERATSALEQEKLKREKDSLESKMGGSVQEALANVRVNISEQIRLEMKQKQDKIEELQETLLQRMQSEKELTERISRMEQNLRPPVILPGAKPENLEHHAQLTALQHDLEQAQAAQQSVKKDYDALRSHLAQMTHITAPETTDEALSQALYTQNVQKWADAVLAKIKDSTELQSRFQPKTTPVEIKNQIETATVLQERAEKVETKQILLTAKKAAENQIEVNHLHTVSNIQSQAATNLDVIAEKINHVATAVQQQASVTSTNVDANVKLALAPLQTALQLVKSKQKTTAEAIAKIGSLAEQKLQNIELFNSHYNSMVLLMNEKINPIHTMLVSLGNLSTVSFTNMENHFKNISEQLKRMELNPGAKIDPIQLATLKNDLQIPIRVIAGQIEEVGTFLSNMSTDHSDNFTSIKSKIAELQTKLVTSETQTKEALDKLANAHEAIEAMKQTCVAALVRPPVECVSKAEVNAQEIATALAPLLNKPCPEPYLGWYQQHKSAPKMKKCKFKTVSGTGVRERGWKRCMNPISLENLNY